MTIFSKIIAGHIPSYKIAENDRFFAFLDIFPLREGHTLIVPKSEVDNFFDMPRKPIWQIFCRLRSPSPTPSKKRLTVIVADGRHRTGSSPCPSSPGAHRQRRRPELYPWQTVAYTRATKGRPGKDPTPPQLTFLICSESSCPSSCYHRCCRLPAPPSPSKRSPLPWRAVRYSKASP